MDSPPRTTKYSTLVNGMSPCFLAFFSGRPSLNPGKMFFFPYVRRNDIIMGS